MDDISSDSELFAFDLPLFTLIVESEYQKHGLPGGLSLMQTPLHGVVFPLFTDRELADRFVTDLGKTGRGVLQIDDMILLVSLLNDMKVIQVAHVGIDCPTDKNPRRESGRYTALQHLIDCLQPQGSR